MAAGVRATALAVGDVVKMLTRQVSADPAEAHRITAICPGAAMRCRCGLHLPAKMWHKW